MDETRTGEPESETSGSYEGVIKGHRDLLESSVLPIAGPWAELQELGFTPGRPVEDDPRFNGHPAFVGFDDPASGPIFRYVTFPRCWRWASWRRPPYSAHILDERGRLRVNVLWDPSYNKEAACSIVEGAPL